VEEAKRKFMCNRYRDLWRKYMRKTIALVVVLLILSMISGCQNSKNRGPDRGPDVTVDESKLPSILFINKTSYDNIITDEDIKNGASSCIVTFYDKNGNYYSCADDKIVCLDYISLNFEYESGNIDNNIELIGNCDKYELQKKAVLLENMYISGKLENAKLDMPDSLPDVEAKSSSWFGLYYDSDGNLQSQILHKEECMTDIYMNDDELNKIYEWLKTALNNS
jgi:hypothetical protein